MWRWPRHIIASLALSAVGGVSCVAVGGTLLGGTSSLTAYLLQGLIFSLLFSAYGFGLFATLPAAQSIGVAFLVALFSVTFASLWRMRFQRGPMEMILRNWTYLGAR